ncbi:MAG: hypothetical protein KF773_41235 [Deltaproteobacteria bacterium]|nr:hypothetical protein [Deltaproteobacteria bacterium]
MRAAATAFAALALGGCWTSSGTATTDPRPSPTGPDVTVELASVTLADECGDTAVLRPPLVPTTTGASPPAPITPSQGPTVPPASVACAPGYSCTAPYLLACEQTSMQLRIANRAATGSQQVRVGKVELLDDNGKRLGELVPRGPMRWSSDDGRYAPWNQLVDGGHTLAVTYPLSAPLWQAMPGGRWQAHARTFQLRVRLVVGTNERTVEKDAITVAMLAPPVPT